MSQRIIVGIDPGQSGAISFYENGKMAPYKMPETERDIYDLLKGRPPESTVVYLEFVRSMPQQGVASVWQFSANYNFIRGCVIALGYVLIDVTPQKWQKSLGCLTHGDKNISKAKAQQLFPQFKITHQNADSLLILEYGRREMSKSLIDTW